MEKVNTFLIGAQKAGTTALCSWLSEHPEINAPTAVKDLHFFLNEEAYRKGLGWYENLFSNKKAKIKLDASVNYLFRPEAAKKIHRYNPNAKIIVVLRDPVKRAFSAFQFFKKLNLEKKEFMEAVEYEQRGNLRTWKEKDDFAYIMHGMYHQQLNHWLQYFDKNKILVVFYEELFFDKENHIREICKFLEINEDFIANGKSKNKTGKVKHKWMNSLVYDRNNKFRKLILNKMKLKKIIPISWRVLILRSFREWNTKKNSFSDRISREEYEELAKLYTNEIKNLGLLINRDLNLIWKF